MFSCWHVDPVDRPDFTQVRKMLEKLAEKLPNKKDINYINTLFPEEEEQLAPVPVEGSTLTLLPSFSGQTMETSAVTVDVHESSSMNEDDRYVVVVSSEDLDPVGHSSVVDVPLLAECSLENNINDFPTDLHTVASKTTQLL